MVNRHFSRACHACRNKHTRCDETKPACVKCTSKGRECPGYRDTNGFLFVDQIAKSANRIRRKRKGAVATTPSSDEHAAATVTIIRDPRPDPGLVSVQFFFNSYLMMSRNTLTSRGHFDYLLPLYSQAQPSSLLALAMELAAGRSMASYYCRSVDSIWHAESLVRASKAMRLAISDPSECLTDETLLAVLLLDLAEYIKTRRMRTAVSHVHQNAATGLVRLRGERNFENLVARSLFNATRSNSVHRAMWGCSGKSMDIALLDNMATDGDQCNPAVQLDELIAAAFRLGQRLAPATESGDREEIALVEAQLEDLSSQLLTWYDLLPEDWTACSHSIKQLPLEFGGVMGPYRKDVYVFETYDTLDVALVINQWRCTRLMVNKSIRLSRRNRPCDDLLDIESANLIRGVWESVPFFIHGTNLAMIDRDFSDGLAEGIQQLLQIDEPSGLGIWFLGSVLDWIIPILQDNGSIVDDEKANGAAFSDLREALSSQMHTAMPSTSRPS